jgi:hypothetical protein
MVVENQNLVNRIVGREGNVPTSTIDTSDWKVYKNSDFGFEIRYPTELRVEATPPSDAGGYGWVLFFNDLNARKPLFSIGMFPNEDPENLYEYLEGTPNTNGLGEFRKIKVNSYFAYFGREEKSDYTDYNYSISSGNKVALFCNLRVGSGYFDSEYIPVFESIVNSLHFF